MHRQVCLLVDLWAGETAPGPRLREAGAGSQAASGSTAETVSRSAGLLPNAWVTVMNPRGHGSVSRSVARTKADEPPT